MNASRGTKEATAGSAAGQGRTQELQGENPLCLRAEIERCPSRKFTYRGRCSSCGRAVRRAALSRRWAVHQQWCTSLAEQPSRHATDDPSQRRLTRLRHGDEIGVERLGFDENLANLSAESHRTLNRNAVELRFDCAQVLMGLDRDAFHFLIGRRDEAMLLR